MSVVPDLSFLMSQLSSFMSHVLCLMLQICEERLNLYVPFFFPWVFPALPRKPYVWSVLKGSGVGPGGAWEGLCRSPCGGWGLGDVFWVTRRLGNWYSTFFQSYTYPSPKAFLLGIVTCGIWMLIIY